MPRQVGNLNGGGCEMGGSLTPSPSLSSSSVASSSTILNEHKQQHHHHKSSLTGLKHQQRHENDASIEHASSSSSSSSSSSASSLSKHQANCLVVASSSSMSSPSQHLDDGQSQNGDGGDDEVKVFNEEGAFEDEKNYSNTLSEDKMAICNNQEVSYSSFSSFVFCCVRFLSDFWQEKKKAKIKSVSDIIYILNNNSVTFFFGVCDEATYKKKTITYCCNRN